MDRSPGANHPENLNGIRIFILFTLIFNMNSSSVKAQELTDVVTKFGVLKPSYERAKALRELNKPFYNWFEKNISIPEGTLAKERRGLVCGLGRSGGISITVFGINKVSDRDKIAQKASEIFEGTNARTVSIVFYEKEIMRSFPGNVVTFTPEKKVFSAKIKFREGKYVNVRYRKHNKTR